MGLDIESNPKADFFGRVLSITRLCMSRFASLRNSTILFRDFPTLVHTLSHHTTRPQQIAIFQQGSPTKSLVAGHIFQNDGLYRG